MKKVILLISFLIAFSQINSYAQGIYLKITPGYSTPTNMRSGFENYSIRYSYAISYVIEEHENINGGFGKGININGTIGYSKNKNLSFELESAFMRGLKFETTSRYIYYGSEDKFTSSYEAQLISFTPTMVLSTGQDKINAYMSNGLILGFPSVKRELVYNGYDGREEQLNIKYSTNLAKGLATKIRLESQLKNERIFFFAEISFTYLMYSPEKSEVTEYLIYGYDSTSVLNTSEKYTEYSDNFSVNYTIDEDTNQLIESYDRSKPYRAARIDMPFGNIRFNLGFKFKI
ncbi:MAG: hypothetical protein IIA45_07400 [Bacteroidetes bacterium]|nr:hypothetical protein [Bacteroidota bacterium]